MTNPEPPRSTSRIVKPTGSTPAAGGNGAPRPTGSHPTGSVRPSTQRVEKAPPSGQTSKIVKQTQSTSVPKTQTQSVAKTTGSVKPITQKMPTAGQKPITQKMAPATSSIKKTTGRSTAQSTRRGSAKANAPTFTLPATKKGRLIMGGAIGFIVVAISVILIINKDKVDPKEVKARFVAESAAINKLQEDVAGMTSERIFEIDRRWQALVEDPQHEMAMESWGRAKVAAKAAHQAAETQKKADRDIRPFIAEYTKLKGTPEDLKAAAQELNDKSSGLIDQYGLTLYGPQLTEIHAEMQKILNEKEVPWPVKWEDLKRDVRKLYESWDCAGALKALNEFATRYKEKDTPLLADKCNDMRRSIKSSADALPNKARDAATRLTQEGKKDDAKKELERAKAGLQGFDDPLKKVEQFIKDMN